MSKKVYVGMSGGVDSSVTAALLQERGFDVTGVYMKNWSQDLPGMHCPWKEDYQDAKRVAVQLGIPFKMYDFQKEYRQKVVNYMIDEYKAGRTPNPDIMCNQEVKFKLFLETALEDGADFIATGHYARIKLAPELQIAGPGGRHLPNAQTPLRPLGSRTRRETSVGHHPHVDNKAALYAGIDRDKDQSYFLCRVTEDALRKSLMPIGEFTKPEVRQLARKFGLSTAEKKDSQGICFVGKVGIKDFLREFVTAKPGSIIDQHDKTVGQHDGAIFYTIGQRQGLHVGGGLPYYVVGKDMAKNEVHVTTDLQDGRLWGKRLSLTSLHWINGEPSATGAYTVRTRYRAGLIKVASIKKMLKDRLAINLQEEVRAVTPGQSAVLYDGDRVVGGGIVC